MPRYLVKPDRDRDLYIEWSTVVDDVTWVGTRAEAERYLRSEFGRRGNAAERLNRADQTGTSAQWPSLRKPAFGWDDDGCICDQQWLPRAKLADYCIAMADGRVLDAKALLEPLPDEDGA